jgi:hypothetical protein
MVAAAQPARITCHVVDLRKDVVIEVPTWFLHGKRHFPMPFSDGITRWVYIFPTGRARALRPKTDPEK